MNRMKRNAKYLNERNQKKMEIENKFEKLKNSDGDDIFKRKFWQRRGS